MLFTNLLESLANHILTDGLPFVRAEAVQYYPSWIFLAEQPTVCLQNGKCSANDWQFFSLRLFSFIRIDFNSIFIFDNLFLRFAERIQFAKIKSNQNEHKLIINARQTMSMPPSLDSNYESISRARRKE